MYTDKITVGIVGSEIKVIRLFPKVCLVHKKFRNSHDVIIRNLFFSLGNSRSLYIFMKLLLKYVCIKNSGIAFIL